MKKYLLIFTTIIFALADTQIAKTGLKNIFHVGDDGTYHRGLDGIPIFRNNTLNVVIDPNTGLMWQDGKDHSADSVIIGITDFVNFENLDEAIDYCDKVAFAGFTDWYLPTYKELLSIVDYSKEYLTSESKFYNVFRNIDVYKPYWSSTIIITESGLESDSVFAVNFASQYHFKHDITEIVKRGKKILRAWIILVIDSYENYSSPPKYNVKCVRKLSNFENLNIPTYFEVDKNSEKKENFEANGFNIAISNRPKYGEVLLNSDSFIYTPAKDYYGNDEFTFKISTDKYEFEKKVRVIVNDLDKIDSKILKVKKGWNLLSIPTKEDLLNPNTYFNSDIYTFKNYQWNINPSKLEYGKGFWIYGDSYKEYSFSEDNYNLELNDLNGGWNLVGTGEKIIDLSSNSKITQVYTYSNQYGWIKNPPIIKSGEGFWINNYKNNNNNIQWFPETIFISEDDCKKVATTKDDDYVYNKQFAQCGMSFFEAQSYCQSQGGRLPTPNELTTIENKEIVNEFLSDKYYWSSDKNIVIDVRNKSTTRGTNYYVRCVK